VTFPLRLVIIALAAFGATGAAASIVMAAISRGRWLRFVGSASSLFQLRLLPACVSTIALVAAVVSFARFEPREGEERTALVLVAFACLGAVTWIAMGARVWRSYVASRRAWRQWVAVGRPLDWPDHAVPAYAIASTFPIVAMVGIVRPRIIVAENVLAACSPLELEAIVAHERSHLRRRDNARRLLMWASPDILMWTTAGRRLVAKWQTATEEEADDEAGRGCPERRLHLAEALLRVARLAPPGVAPVDLPASALYRGEDLADRVRRLVDPNASRNTSSRRRNWTLATAFVLLPASLLALRAIHDWMEIAIAFLP
jgi:BlaR1 peptidase M56